MENKNQWITTAADQLWKAKDLISEWSKKSPWISGVVAQLAFYGALKIVGTILKRRVKKNTVLELYLSTEKTVIESELDPSSKSWFGSGFLSLRELVEMLGIAAGDSRVSGLIVRANSLPPISLAQIQEIGEAIAKFKDNKKKAILYAENLDYRGSIVHYYFATFFDKIFIAPPGFVSLVSFRIDQPFLKHLFEKIGIEPEFGKRKDYKTAVDMFLEDKMTDANKEMMKELMDGIDKQIKEAIAAKRGLTFEQVQKLVETGPFVSEAALEAKLVDGVCYRDELYEKVLPAEFGFKDKKEMNLLFFERYMPKVQHLRPYLSGKHQIAVIYAEGNIYQGKSQLPPSSPSIGSDTICEALRAATKDKNIKAIILRVNSGGGSYIASDVIAQEMRKAKAAGKYIVASMSSVAASGGYYISMEAHKILVDPGTITGSIGVFYGKFVTRKMWEKIGVTWDGLEGPSNSKYYNSLYVMDEENKKIREGHLDYIYKDFTTKVAKARNLTVDQVEAAAQGRVWMGSDAKTRLIVDEIGSFERAIQVCKELAGIKPQDKVKLVTFPRHLSILSRLLVKPSNSEDKAAYGPSWLPFSGLIQQVLFWTKMMKTASQIMTPIVPLASAVSHQIQQGETVSLTAPYL